MPLRVAVGIGLEQRRGISLFLGDGQQVSGCVVGVIISEIGFCLSRLVICLRRQLVLAIIGVLDELVEVAGALPDFLQVSDVVVNVLFALEEHAAVAAEADVAELHLRAAAVPAHVTIRVSRVHNNGASAFRCNAIQALEGIVAEAQAVARCGRHGRQAAVAFFPVAVGVALRVGLRAERPALAGEAVKRIVKVLRSLRDRAVFIHGRAADEPPEAVVLKGVGADRLAVLLVPQAGQLAFGVVGVADGEVGLSGLVIRLFNQPVEEVVAVGHGHAVGVGRLRQVAAARSVVVRREDEAARGADLLKMKVSSLAGVIS